MAGRSGSYPTGSPAPRVAILGGLVMLVLGLFFLIGGEGLSVRDGLFGLGTMPLALAILLGVLSLAGLILMFWGIGNSAGRQPSPIAVQREKPLTLQPPIGR